MTCREVADFMMDYLSHELSSDRRGRFERHVSLCTNCEMYLAGYEETVEISKKAFNDEDADWPTEVPAELLVAILATRRS